MPSKIPINSVSTQCICSSSKLVHILICTSTRTKPKNHWFMVHLAKSFKLRIVSSKFLVSNILVGCNWHPRQIKPQAWMMKALCRECHQWTLLKLWNNLQASRTCIWTNSNNSNKCRTGDLNLVLIWGAKNSRYSRTATSSIKYRLGSLKLTSFRWWTSQKINRKQQWMLNDLSQFTSKVNF